jgi:hypothetical protein
VLRVVPPHWLKEDRECEYIANPESKDTNAIKFLKKYLLTKWSAKTPNTYL